jgi:hypothetical protein
MQKESVDKEVPHGVLVIKPKQPFLDWLDRVYEEDAPYKLESFQQDQTSFLVGDELEARDIERLLKKHHKDIFERELEGWTLDMDAWPARRGWKTFQEWFTWEYHSMLFILS